MKTIAVVMKSMIKDGGCCKKTSKNIFLEDVGLDSRKWSCEVSGSNNNDVTNKQNDLLYLPW